MDYKQAWEQLEYTIIARLEILSDLKEPDPINEHGRQNCIHALELTLKKMQAIESRIPKFNGLKIVT